MLNKLRGFSNTKLAGVLIGIIIIPFVFWGMGSVFSGGNTNNVAKINNHSISTKDFMDHLNRSGLREDIIKENIDNNILEKILSEMVSNKLLEMEIDDLKVFLSEKMLANLIKSNENFLDDKNTFSRIKYEKFLLENNLTAPDFENRFKKQELKKNLFNYISGGIQSPYFLKNKIYAHETKKVDLDYFDLNVSYNTVINDSDIDKFIEENKESLTEDFIDFSYTKITPKNLLGIDQFNDEFFKTIDLIENDILNESNIVEISNNYNLKLKSKNNYKMEDEVDEILREIYSKRNDDKIQLIEKNDYFLLFEISKINKILPDRSNTIFLKKIKENLILKNKLDLHQDLFKKIQDKQINNVEFINIAKSEKNIEKIIINGITDYSMFDMESIKLIYSLPEKSFILITDEKNNIYLAKINNIFSKELNNEDGDSKKYFVKSNNEIINDIYLSYDFSLNSKYKVKFFQSTLDRVKNYFR